MLLGQTYFNQRFPPEPGTWGSGTRSVELNGDAYFTNRWSASNATGFTQYQFCKIDMSGNAIDVLDSLIDTNQFVVFGPITKVEGGGFVEVGSFTNYASRLQYFGVYKLDELGFRNIVVDTNMYPYIYIKRLIELPSKNLILVGDIREVPGSFSAQHIVIIKTDSLGHQLWKKTYRKSVYDWNGECISLCPDGGFIIGGAEVNYTGNDSFTRGLVMKVDSNGTHQWHRFFGGHTHSSKPVYGISTTKNGGYAFVGGIGLPHWGGLSGTGISPWVVGLSPGGGVIWADTLEPSEAVDSRWNYYSDIEMLEDSAFIVTGQFHVWDSLQTVPDKFRIHGVLSKYSSSGERQWLRKYRHPEVPDESYAKHLLFDVDPTPDGGFVAAGWLGPSNDNTQDTWIIKVDSFGCLVKGCELVSVPLTESSIASLKVYPNPANDVIHFDVKGKHIHEPLNLQLYDITGRLVRTQILKQNDNTIDVGHLKPGLYTYRLNETYGSFVVE